MYSGVTNPGESHTTPIRACAGCDTFNVTYVVAVGRIESKMRRGYAYYCDSCWHLIMRALNDAIAGRKIG